MVHFFVTKNVGVKVQGKTIKILRFPDDVAMLANTERELGEALNATKTVFNNYNMEINIRKIKVIACRTQFGKKRFNIKIGNEKIGKISEFCYLGCKITRDGLCNADMRSRIGQAKKAFAKIPHILVLHTDLEIRKELLRTNI